jgi:hypothetical protein
LNTRKLNTNASVPRAIKGKCEGFKEKNKERVPEGNRNRLQSRLKRMKRSLKRKEKGRTLKRREGGAATMKEK